MKIHVWLLSTVVTFRLLEVNRDLIMETVVAFDKKLDGLFEGIKDEI